MPRVKINVFTSSDLPDDDELINSAIAPITVGDRASRMKSLKGYLNTRGWEFPISLRKFKIYLMMLNFCEYKSVMAYYYSLMRMMVSPDSEFDYFVEIINKI